ncbi:MAG: hypothetical protein GYB36_01885 [Alphaproteobacteria bacterium]|nr:hypothetical protein [Alphaproteobacteria bacterium]
MSDWKTAPEIDEAILNTLVSAVGAEAFSAMKVQFIEDLKSLHLAYQAASDAQNESAARETAHALKGAASNIGLARLGALAASLEHGQVENASELEPVFSSALNRLNEVA